MAEHLEFENWMKDLYLVLSLDKSALWQSRLMTDLILISYNDWF